MPSSAYISNGNTVSEPPKGEYKPLDYTLDQFHDGAFSVAQPAAGGHRSGLDALLLAASLRHGTSGILADLGAGSGAAGLAALNLHEELDLLAVELNDVMFGLLNTSFSNSHNARFSNRTRALQADITLSGTKRLEEGLENSSVDHTIMNPPYNTYSYRPPANAIKYEAHMLGEGGLDSWFRTASAITKTGGSLSMIYRADDIAAVVACAQGRFGKLQIIPIHSRKDEPAKRILVCGIRGSKAPLSILPGFTVHEDNGSFSEHAKAIFNGERRLLD